MPTSDNIGSLFTGLTKGFGRSYFEGKQRKHQEELDKETKQYQVLQDAMKVATQRGDTGAIAHILRSMEEFQAASGAGKRGKAGKEGRAKQQGILSAFADKIEGGKATPEGQQAQQHIQATQESGGDLTQETRPRQALTKPLFASDEELAQKDINIAVEKERRLEPIKTKEFEKRQEAETKKSLAVEQEKQKGREAIAKTKEEAIIGRDANKLAQAIYDEGKERGMSYEEAHRQASSIISDKAKAQVAIIESRIDKMEHDENLADTKFKAQDRHWKAIEKRMEASTSQGERRLQQGDKRLALQADKEKANNAQAKAIHEQSTAIRSQMKDLVSRINKERGTISNPLLDVDDPAKKRAEIEFKRLQDEYEAKARQLNNLMTKFDEVAPKEEEAKPKSLGNKSSGKSLTKPSVNNDPLGIH